MRPVLRAEWLKQATTKTVLALVAAMTGLVLLSVLLHGFGFSTGRLSERSNQLRVLVEAGEGLGTVFAGLIGAMSITAEIRHGTIRPTLLATPQRGRIVAAKAAISVLTGLVFGLLATGIAAALGSAVLSARHVAIHLDGGAYALLLVGGAVAGALWAVIGVGLGAIVRNQVTAIVTIFVWIEIIENLLIDGAPSVSKYMPAALGQAITGDRIGTLHPPALGAVFLAVYAAGAIAAAVVLTSRRDFA
jgi:ABC-type transport system involved in multi-copper enzyme maturation permease subunit